MKRDLLQGVTNLGVELSRPCYVYVSGSRDHDSDIYGFIKYGNFLTIILTTTIKFWALSIILPFI
jgi:hypothetical protein